jgi:flagellar hook-length control protein FliK
VSIGIIRNPLAAAPGSNLGGSAPKVDGILAQLAWSAAPASSVPLPIEPPVTSTPNGATLPAITLPADAAAPEQHADLEAVRTAPVPPALPGPTPAELPASTPESAGPDAGAGLRAAPLPSLAAAAAADAAPVIPPNAPVAPPSPPVQQTMAVAGPTPFPAALAEAADTLPQQVLWQIGQGRQEARIQLRPRELGSVDVQIRIDGDRAHLVFGVEQPQARAVVQAALPLLAQQFAAQGLQLGNTEVRADVQPDPRPPPFTPPRPGEQSAPDDAVAVLAPARRLRVGLFDQYA